MKKFVKLAAVCAALFLSLGCLVACSNNSDSSGSGSGDVSSLQGLWVLTSDPSRCAYFKGNQYWMGVKVDNSYYYLDVEPKIGILSKDNVEDGAIAISVSGNKLTLTKDGASQTSEFSVSGNTLTVGSAKYTKVNAIPIAVSTLDDENFKKVIVAAN